MLTDSAQPHRISSPCYLISLNVIEIKIQKKETEISSDLAGGSEQDERMIQGGRDLRRSLVQSPAHSWVTFEARSGSSGPHPVTAWKQNLQRQSAQPRCASHGTAWLFSLQVISGLPPDITCKTSQFSCPLLAIINQHKQSQHSWQSSVPKWRSSFTWAHLPQLCSLLPSRRQEQGTACSLGICVSHGGCRV